LAAHTLLPHQDTIHDYVECVEAEMDGAP